MASRGSGGSGSWFNWGDGSRSSRSTGIGEALAAEAKEAMQAAELIEGAMKKIGNAILSIQGGKDIEKYWDSQRASIENVIEAYERFSKFESTLTAQNLLKEINAFEAFNTEGKSILDFTDRLGEGFEKLYAKAQELGKGLDTAYTKNNLREYAEAYTMLKSAGINVDDFVDRMKHDESELKKTNQQLENDLARTRSALQQAQDDLQNALSGATFEEMNDKLNQFSSMAEQAKEEFRGFLLSIGEDSNEVWNESGGKFGRYFQMIEQGILTANQAILKFREDTKFFGGEINADSVTVLLAKFQELAEAIDIIKEAVAGLKDGLNFGDMSDAPRAMRELASGAESASEQTANLINSAREYETLRGLVTALEDLVAASRETESGVSSAGAAVSQMLDSVATLSGADSTALDNVARILRSLASMNGMSVGAASMRNLVSTISALSDIPDTSKLVGISSVNFHNFDDLHISKASLRNLAENLPAISAVDVSPLERLAAINWKNLNELSISKSAINNVTELATKATATANEQANKMLVSVVVTPEENSIQETVNHIKTEVGDAIDVPVKVHADTSELKAEAQKSEIDMARLVKIDALADRFAEARKMLSSIKKEIKEAFSSDDVYGERDWKAAENLRKALNNLHQSFAETKDLAGSVANLWDALFTDDGVVKANSYLDLIKEIEQRVSGLSGKIESAKVDLEIAHINPVTEEFGDAKAVAADIDEAMNRAKSGVRGLAEEMRAVQTEEAKAAEGAQHVAEGISAAQETIKDAGKAVNITVQLDEGSLQAAAERIQTELSKPVNVKINADTKSAGSISTELQDASKEIQSELNRKNYKVSITVDQIKMLPDAEEKLRRVLESFGALMSNDMSQRFNFDPYVIKQIDELAEAEARLSVQSGETFNALRRIASVAGQKGFFDYAGLGTRNNPEELLRNIEKARRKMLELNEAGKANFNIEAFDKTTTAFLEASKRMVTAKAELQNVYGDDSHQMLAQTNQMEAYNRARTGVRGLTEELQSLVDESSKVKEASEDMSEAISDAMTFRLDETSLSSLSQTIQDAIQKATANIKLTIEHVQLSAGALKEISDQVAQGASGAKTKTGKVDSGTTAELKAEAEAATAATEAKQKSAEASKEVAQANQQVAETAKEAVSAEKEMGEAAESNEVNVRFVQELIQLYEQLNVWIAKNGSAYEMNKEQLDASTSAVNTAIADLQATIDGYLNDVKQAGTVTEETLQGLKAAFAQIKSIAAAKDAASKASAQAAAEDAKKQKATVQEISDLYIKLYNAQTNKFNAAKIRDDDGVAKYREEERVLKELVATAEGAYPALAKLAKGEDEVTRAMDNRDQAQRTLNMTRARETETQAQAIAKELAAYQEQISKLTNFKGIRFFTDDTSMESWNKEVQKTEEILQRLTTAQGKARIPIIEELNKQLANLQSKRDQLNEVSRAIESLNNIGTDATAMKFSGNAEAVSAYEAQVRKVQEAIEALRTAEAGQVNDAVAGVQRETAALAGLKQSFTDTASSAQSMASAQQQATNLANKIDLFLSKNGALASSLKTQLQGWSNELRSGSAVASGSLNKIKQDFTDLQQRINAAHLGGKTFFQTMQEGWRKFGGWSIVSRTFMSVIRIFKQAVTSVKEIDAAMTELKKVTSETSAEYEKFFEDASKIASDVGAKISDVVNATAD